LSPDYEGALRDVIHSFKYEGRWSLAAPLAGLARRCAAEALEGCHCAIPVPLHPWRRLRRGFNQADEIARALRLPVVHALWRIRATPPQTRLGAGARRRNVGRAFILSPWMRTRRARAAWLADRVVLLVDDVRTTGATLESCAEVLRAAGVREVRTLTVARAARRLP
jgi:ComF family protein